MWRERERIATHLHNMGVSWDSAWKMADNEIEIHLNPPAGFTSAVTQQTEVAEVAQELYFIYCESDDDMTTDPVSDPRRIMSAARIAHLIRAIKSAVPGASVTIGIPGVPPSVMAYLGKHVSDTLVIKSEYGDVVGEPFTPSQQAGERQRTLIADSVSRWVPDTEETE